MDDATATGALLFFIFLAVIAAIPAAIAQSKGHSFFAWWIYGVLLWIVALIHSTVIAPVRKCPYCAEGIKPEAKVCPHCQRDLLSTEKAAAPG
jgi:hypothetical protein